MLNYKNWSIYFAASLLGTCILFAAFNYTIDPFGVFGDNYLKMYSYDISLNTRTGKLAYLDQNYQKFNSYIIGGSKSGSLNPKTAEKYYPGAHFYNLNMVGGKFYDYEQTINYLANNYQVKNIILQISQLEADQIGTSSELNGMLHGKLVSNFPVLFYLKYLFANPSYAAEKLQTALNWNANYEAAFFFQSSNGSYNRTAEEKQIATNPNLIFANKARFPAHRPMVKGSAYAFNLQVLKRIVDLCRAKQINLLVVASPTYTTELETYPPEKLAVYMKEIAKITNYWNFSGYNSVNTNKTNFYDDRHFRQTVGDMMLAKIFGDSALKPPEDFGTLITSENAAQEINTALAR